MGPVDASGAGDRVPTKSVIAASVGDQGGVVGSGTGHQHAHGTKDPR
jgi:hypothetical protein